MVFLFIPKLFLQYEYIVYLCVSAVCFLLRPFSILGALRLQNGIDGVNLEDF